GGWGPDLTEELPHQTPAEGPGRGLPEVVAVGPAGVEVEAAVIGMGELVVVELVVVPLPGKLDVVGPGAERDVRPLPLGHPLGERPGDKLHRHQLPGPRPESLRRIAVGTGDMLAQRSGPALSQRPVLGE